MNKYILVPLETAEYLGFDNKNDEVVMVGQIEYKYIDMGLFVDGIGVPGPNQIKLTIDELYK